MRVILLYIVFLSVGQLSLCAQDVIISLQSKTDNLPIVDAFVSFTTLNGSKLSSTVSDKNGEVVIPHQLPVIIHITHLNYLDVDDTLRSAKTTKYVLEPVSISMDEVVVTAQYSPDDPKNSVYPVKVIKREEFEKRGVTNVKELLSQEMNIRLNQDQFLGSSFTMQGLGGENVKVLIDGVPVIGRLNGNIDLSQLNLNNVTRVEIIEGPLSVQYGTNALGGVINLITDKTQQPKFNAAVNGYTESVGTYNLDVGIGLGKGKHHVDINAGRYFFGGYAESDTVRKMDWKPKTQYFGDIKYQINFKRLDLITSLSAYYEKISNKASPVFTPYDIYAFDSYFYTNRYNGSVRLKGKILKNHYLDQTFAYSYFSRRKNTLRKDLVTLEEGLTPNIADQDTSQFDAILARGFVSRNKKNKIFNYQLGYDINVERGRGKRIDNNQQVIGDYALFTSFNIKPIDIIAMQFGFRWAYNSQFKSVPTPSVNLKIKPIEQLTIRASYAKGFRSPSIKELYFYFVDIIHNVQGNPNLNPEKSDNVNLHIEYKNKFNKHTLKIQPTLFFNNVNQQIRLVQTGSVEFVYQNINKFQSYGADLTLGYTFEKQLNIRLSGGITGNKNDFGVALSNQFFYSPEFSIQASYTIPKALVTVSVFNKFNGKYQQLFLNESLNIAERSVAQYNIMDISASRSFVKNRIHLTAGVKNVFNVINVNSSGGGGGIHSSDATAALVGYGTSFFTSLKLNFANK